MTKSFKVEAPHSLYREQNNAASEGRASKYKMAYAFAVSEQKKPNSQVAEKI